MKYNLGDRYSTLPYNETAEDSFASNDSRSRNRGSVRNIRHRWSMVVVGRTCSERNERNVSRVFRAERGSGRVIIRKVAIAIAVTPGARHPGVIADARRDVCRRNRWIVLKVPCTANVASQWDAREPRSAACSFGARQ